MGSLQDGDVHGEDVAVGGYIYEWDRAVNGNGSKSVATAPAASAGGTGRLQDGEVHGDDVSPGGYIDRWYRADQSGGPR